MRIRESEKDEEGAGSCEGRGETRGGIGGSVLSAFLLVVGGGFCGGGLVVLLMAGFKRYLLLVFLNMILTAVGLLAYAAFALQ